MNIGIIREGKTPPDRRVPFTPEQCTSIQNNHPGTHVIIQPSPIRKIPDEAYKKAGLQLSEDLSNCDVLMGVKEVNIQDLIADKTYFFFSHTIKKQPYNRGLLRAVLEKNIRLVDYETLCDKKGFRLLGFGRFAGIVGAYNTLCTWGLREGSFELKRAHLCADMKELVSGIRNITLPPVKIIVTGKGRVGHGAREILEAAGIPEVDENAFLNEPFNTPVFCQIDADAYNENTNGSPFSFEHFFAHPESYRGTFHRFAAVADIFIACHFWDARSPVLLSREDLSNPACRLKVIGDISCDIGGPVASTVRASTIADPVYGYDPVSGKETAFGKNALSVMAVDNLPCELPYDASEDFGRQLLDKVMPALLGDDPADIIGRASIADKGILTPHFNYLQDYVYGD